MAQSHDHVHPAGNADRRPGMMVLHLLLQPSEQDGKYLGTETGHPLSRAYVIP